MTDANLQSDECYRCGYDLRGIVNDQACPECGLLAERSRRITDELHETRPRWLRLLSLGVILILLSILLALAWGVSVATVIETIWTTSLGHWIDPVKLVVSGFAVAVLVLVIGVRLLRRRLSLGVIFILLSVLLALVWSAGVGTIIKMFWTFSLSSWIDPAKAIALGFAVAALVLVFGVYLLSRREGYRPADRADRWLRRFLRMASTMPLIAVFALFLPFVNWERAIDHFLGPQDSQSDDWLVLAPIAIGALVTLSLPLLLFLRLRGLAKRARSAHLAEHCMIVGIGTTLALFYMAGVYALVIHLESTVDPNWTCHSNVSLGLMVAVGVVGCLFILWSIYLMVRFAIAFTRAARQASRKWKRDDRAVAVEMA